MLQSLPSLKTTADNLEISVYHKLAELQELVPAWIALLQDRPSYGFHHHPAWYLALKQTLLADSLCCVVVSKQGLILAILPFSASRDMRHLRSPTHDHISLGDWILRSPVYVDTVLMNLSRIAKAVTRSDWAKLSLNLVLENSEIAQYLIGKSPPNTTVAAQQSYLYLITKSRQSFWFDCSATPDDQKGQRLPLVSSRLGRNLRRRRNKLAAVGAVCFQQCSAQSARSEALRDFLRIEASGWKGERGQGTAIANHRELLAFYQELLETDLPGWNPSINLLSVNNQPVAAQIQITTGNTGSLLKIAYDESWSSFSPGALALEDLLLSCSQNPHLERLSLVTCPQWAWRWHPQKTAVYNIGFYNFNVRGKLMKAMDDGLQKLKQTKSQLRSPGQECN